MPPSASNWLGMSLEFPLCGQLSGHPVMIREDVCPEGKPPKLAHVLMAGEPVLRWPLETTTYLKLHTYGLHLMHIIITECIMGRDMRSQNKLDNVLLSIILLFLIRGTPLSVPFQSPFSLSFGHKWHHKQQNRGLEFYHSGLLPSSVGVYFYLQ
jgi:hypothetical protein